MSSNLWATKFEDYMLFKNIVIKPKAGENNKTLWPKLDTVICIPIPRIQEAEAAGLPKVQGWPGLHSHRSHCIIIQWPCGKNNSHPINHFWKKSHLKEKDTCNSPFRNISKIHYKWLQKWFPHGTRSMHHKGAFWQLSLLLWLEMYLSDSWGLKKAC